VLVGLVVAIKFYSDDYFTNSIYSNLGGITADELNFLETHFLRLIGYNLVVNKIAYKESMKTMKKSYERYIKLKKQARVTKVVL